MQSARNKIENNFWTQLKRPFFALAPMHEITDPVFRRVVVSLGKPDVFFTEFVSADGLCSIGREHLEHALRFDESERPIVAQIFGADPEKFFEVAKIISAMGFDGIDINMGCPNVDVVKNGAGAGLIKKPELAKKIIEATKAGANGLPVSVKTRVGYSDAKDFDDWISMLLAQNLAAITIHARTKSQMYGGEANWKYIRRAVELRDAIQGRDALQCVSTLIIGNGDVRSIEDGKKRAEEFGCDGIAIGRAAFNDPWIFSGNHQEPTRKQRFDCLINHAELFEKAYEGIHSFGRMKRFYRSYINGFDGAKELRLKLMEAKGPDEVRQILADSI